jgi:hypothetical protein
VDAEEMPSELNPKPVDRLRSLVLGAVGSVPVAGSVVSAVVAEIWQSPIQERVQAFLLQLEQRVDLLESTTEEIGRDAVLTAVVMGAREALAADAAKVRLLAQAVANVIGDQSWQHDETATLMRMIGDLTATHIKVLDLLNDPARWESRTGIRLAPVARDRAYFQRDMISAALGDPEASDVALQVILQDLESLGFLNSVGLADENPSEAARDLMAYPSPVGKRLIEFVTAPSEVPAVPPCV